MSVCLVDDGFFADNDLQKVLGFRFQAQSLWPGRIALVRMYIGEVGIMLKSVSDSKLWEVEASHLVALVDQLFSTQKV